jgi:hypothetical protein
MYLAQYNDEFTRREAVGVERFVNICTFEKG